MKRDRAEVLALIRRVAVIPAIRVASAEDAHFAAVAVTGGGIPVVELTMTIPGAIEVIAELTRRDPDLAVGAGTVLDTMTAQRCVDAGAAFLTAPEFHPQLLAFARECDVLAMPGALTPTEIAAAWRAGADLIKVFPCGPLGGERYIKALHTSLPQIPLVAAGGVNQHTAVDFLLAGAVAVGVGAELIPAEAIRRRQHERITELAGRFASFVRDARERIAASGGG